MKGYRAWLVAALLGSMPVCAFAQADIARFIKKDAFRDIKLSPTGEFYAASVPVEGKTILVILRRSDNKLTGTFALGKNTHIEDFWWVNDERVLMSASEKFGELDAPQLTGELYALNADGGDAEILVGQRVQGAGLGTKIQPKKVERIAAFLIDDLPADDKNVLISVSPFTDDPYTRAERMDVYTGRRQQVARAPVRRAEFTADNSGIVRFAHGAGIDNIDKLYYRAGEGKEWKLINDEAVSERVEIPLGFSADDSIAYLQVEQTQGPDEIVAMDIASGARKGVLRDDDTDPYRVIYRAGSSIPVGAWYMDGKPRSDFFDAAFPEARQYRSLQTAFPGETALITSTTQDGKLALVQTASDRNPGDFFVFDTSVKKAAHLISRRNWFDPDEMAEMRPIALTSRDGLPLKGYLTLPKAASGRNLPTVVIPHGGPFGIFDRWGFDDEVQMLAGAGYAVLQLNFRGSGNYGRAFEHAGARQWGGAMQDDVTDATRWLIQQGIADAQRICIYGASYGAYAALMGAAKEPSLYRCAAGYVGVYDLPMMHTSGDIQRRGSGETYLREWIGDRDKLSAASPNRMAERIKIPVFLAAGGEDQRAPIEHSRLMERALAKAGVPVETLYYDTEGHGFYTDAHRQEFYSKLLAFLARSIGGSNAKTTGSVK